MAIWYGYNAPFLKNGNVLPVQQDAKLVKNDLILLLLTNFGERVMKPSLGSPIPSLQFENVVDADLAVIRESLVSIINKYEPRVTVVDLILKPKQDDNMLIINLYGKVNLQPSNKFNIEIGVTGQGGIAFLRAA